MPTVNLYLELGIFTLNKHWSLNSAMDLDTWPILTMEHSVEVEAPVNKQ